jgi:hypothetical protein
MTTEPTDKTDQPEKPDCAEGPPEPPEKVDDGSAFLVSLIVMIGMLAGIELFYRDSPIDLQLRKGSGHISAKVVEYGLMGGDIVTTGNSRMYHAIKPSAIEEALRNVKGGRTYTTYNFGIPSGTPPMFLMIANEAARHKPPPKVFIIGTTPVLSSCCDELAPAGAPLGMSPSVIPAFVRAAWWSSPEDAGLAVFLGASRLLSGRTELLASIHVLTIGADIRFTERGYYSMGGPVGPAAQDARARGRSVPYADAMDKSKGAQIHVTGHRYLAEAIKLLQRAGTKVILMGAPQARQLDWYHDDKHTYPEYLHEMDKLSKRFNIEFIDMNAPPVLDNSHFVDGDHLTDPGAAVFSKYLAETVIARYLP